MVRGLLCTSGQVMMYFRSVIDIIMNVTQKVFYGVYLLFVTAVYSDLFIARLLRVESKFLETKTVMCSCDTQAKA